MPESVDELKKKIAYYEKKLAIGDSDLAMRGYLSFVKVVNQQVNYLDDFDIKTNISGKKAETAEYDRAESLWNNLPKMISSLNHLKAELKIEFDENEGKPKVGPTSPQSIGR